MNHNIIEAFVNYLLTLKFATPKCLLVITCFELKTKNYLPRY